MRGREREREGRDYGKERRKGVKRRREREEDSEQKSRLKCCQLEGESIGSWQLPSGLELLIPYVPS